MTQVHIVCLFECDLMTVKPKNVYQVAHIQLEQVYNLLKPTTNIIGPINDNFIIKYTVQ